MFRLFHVTKVHVTKVRHKSTCHKNCSLHNPHTYMFRHFHVIKVHVTKVHVTKLHVTKVALYIIHTPTCFDISMSSIIREFHICALLSYIKLLLKSQFHKNITWLFGRVYNTVFSSTHQTSKLTTGTRDCRCGHKYTPLAQETTTWNWYYC